MGTVSSSHTRKRVEIKRHEILSSKSSQYLVEKVLGEGCFGKVAQCTKVDTKEKMALKILGSDESGTIELLMLQELRRLDPDKVNLVKLTEHFHYSGYVCLAFEMLDVTLYDYMREMKFRPMHLFEIQMITQQLLVALNALKSIGMVHADIKPDNIMFINRQRHSVMVKLIDFGMARPLWLLQGGPGRMIQPLPFRAPEVILGLELDEAVDMWSLGCVLMNTHQEYIDATKGTPHKCTESNEPTPSLEDMLEFSPDLMGNIQERKDTMALLCLLKHMLKVDPEKRIKASDALENHFITKLQWKDINPTLYVSPDCLTKLLGQLNESTDGLNEASTSIPSFIGSIEPLEMGTVSSSHTRKRVEIKRHEILSSKSSQYLVEKVLGEGCFGKVAQCTKVDTKEKMALKILGSDESGTIELLMLQELRRLDPDKVNLVKLTEHFHYSGYVCLAFEMLDVTLYDYMREMKFRPMHLFEIQMITQQLLVALNALKSIGMVHADIKPDNIMFINRQRHSVMVKLIDFGMARPLWLLQGGPGRMIQPLPFRAPEVILGLELDEAVDMWSLGCVLAFMCLGQSLYPGCEYKVIKETSNEPTPSLEDMLEFSPDLMGNIQERKDTMALLCLLKHMLKVDPEKRIKASDALENHFITKLQWKDINPTLYVSPDCLTKLLGQLNESTGKFKPWVGENNEAGTSDEPSGTDGLNEASTSVPENRTQSDRKGSLLRCSP
uniref:Protein kinase domain-containing protein n=1 Tax=Anabas testudineus TaxID=64144 RepID=A0A7N6BME1_ANATE